METNYPEPWSVLDFVSSPAMDSIAISADCGRMLKEVGFFGHQPTSRTATLPVVGLYVMDRKASDLGSPMVSRENIGKFTPAL